MTKTAQEKYYEQKTKNLKLKRGIFYIRIALFIIFLLLICIMAFRFMSAFNSV